MSGPNVRVVGELQTEAAAYAARIGVSLNALVAVALRDYLDSRKATETAPAPPKADGPREALGLAAVPARHPQIEVTTKPDPKRKPRPKASAAPPTAARESVPKVGRNDPCPCGSGRKAKQCHPENC